MKKLFLAFFMMLFAFTSTFADNKSELKRLKVQQKVLKLNTDLNKLKTNYQKALADLHNI